MIEKVAERLKQHRLFTLYTRVQIPENPIGNSGKRTKEESSEVLCVKCGIVQTLRQSENKRLEAFEMWMWRRMERVKWTNNENEAVLERVGEEKIILKLIRKMKRNSRQLVTQQTNDGRRRSIRSENNIERVQQSVKPIFIWMDMLISIIVATGRRKTLKRNISDLCTALVTVKPLQSRLRETRKPGEGDLDAIRESDVDRWAILPQPLIEPDPV
ncbi:hypothetical protein ANN_21414 [Periplaneta americana]|uniref:Uncharacterized protein n=1 Tax=Periplaneta americana TaxID=6978 RepID=A0ABQ8SFB2_PERAM|nr:hypothetical protein ANN_21414 [Periplaneta americana]